MVKELLQNDEIRAKLPKELLQMFEGTKSQRKKLMLKFKEERLHSFIELANLLPTDYAVADLNEIIGRDDDTPDSNEDVFAFWIKKYKLLLIYLEKFPTHFKEYVLEDSENNLAQINMSNLHSDENSNHISKIYGALCRYDDFRDVREKLVKLFRVTQTSSGRHWASFLLLSRIPVHASFSIGKDGIAKVSLDSFAETINGVDVTRIRECKDCQRIFWAKRKDQSCCSTDCANRHHVRQHREKYAKDPIAYKLQRLSREERRDTKKGR